MESGRAFDETEGLRPGAAGGRRAFLFLQGPISPFFDRLGRALVARGHRVHRINLHFGDRLFWRLPATDFRGRFADWRRFVAAFLDEQRITDLVLHGDRRPYHLVAAEEARARGIAVFVTDLGYVRPDWLTLEYDGLTTYSRFPRDAQAVRALAARMPEPDLEPRFHTPFWLIAAFDVAYNLGLVFGRPLYPHYRYHSVCHPFVEYAGWIRSRLQRAFAGRAAAAAKARLAQRPGSYFLVPLQIATDFQIRAHSPYRDPREAAQQIVRSFARSGSGKKLVFIAHPLDNGLIDWPRFIARLARRCGVGGQVTALPGGTPLDLLRNAAGVVTINSTVGATALHQGVPVKALGNAIYDIAGLTAQMPLDEFWRAPPPPDPALLRDFLRALVGATQVKGGYYERASQACAITGFVERLERGPYPLPPLAAADFAARPPRAALRTIVVSGASGRIGAALARASAVPGARLVLIGEAAGPLGRLTEDCRQRGAAVEAICGDARGAAARARQLAALDRAGDIDMLIVHAPDLLGAMDIVAAAGRMRRRRRGRIVLVGGPADQAALAGYATGLRRRLQADGVALALVAPSPVALRLALWWRAPDLALADAEALAERVVRGLRRGRARIAAPSAATAVRRALGLLPSRLAELARHTVLPPLEAGDEAAEEATLSGESASAD
jgi:capsular polysaccharide export protein